MKRLIIALFCAIPVQLQAQEDAIAITQSFIEHLQNEDFEQAHTFFSKDIKEGFPIETFGQMWGQITEKFGKFKKFSHNCTEDVDGDTHVYTTCVFKESTFDIKAIVSPKNLIKSFTMSEIHDCSEEESAYKSPSYEDPALFHEEEIVFESGRFKIPGTLCRPLENDKKTVIIFVHGSGPNNRDEELGPNKMFRDLAVGLAAKGHMTLRYDKRTLLAEQFTADDMNNFTIDFEVLDDIEAAISFLQSNEQTKDRDIYLLGHSLGGMMIQKTAVDNEAVKGIIMMAGPASPFEDLLPYQYEYILGLDGKISKDEQKTIDDITAKVARVKGELHEGIPAHDLPMNIPAGYWMSLKKHDQIALAKEYMGRICVMNGARDYQVPLSEFQKWKDALGEKEGVSFIECPKLNHFFLPGEGKPSPADYDIQTNVPEYVIVGIADWLEGKLE